MASLGERFSLSIVSPIREYVQRRIFFATINDSRFWRLIERISEEGFWGGLKKFYYQDTRHGNIAIVKREWYLVPEDEFDPLLESKFERLERLTKEERSQVQNNLILRREIAHQIDILRSDWKSPHKRPLRHITLKDELISRNALVKTLQTRLKKSKFQPTPWRKRVRF